MSDLAEPYIYIYIYVCMYIPYIYIYIYIYIYTHNAGKHIEFTLQSDCGGACIYTYTHLHIYVYHIYIYIYIHTYNAGRHADARPSRGCIGAGNNRRRQKSFRVQLFSSPNSQMRQALGLRQNLWARFPQRETAAWRKPTTSARGPCHVTCDSDMWMSHAIYEWVMSHINLLFHHLVCTRSVPSHIWHVTVTRHI